jgi:hypothetical protein
VKYCFQSKRFQDILIRVILVKREEADRLLKTIGFLRPGLLPLSGYVFVYGFALFITNDFVMSGICMTMAVLGFVSYRITAWNQTNWTCSKCGSDNSPELRQCYKCFAPKGK